MISKLTKLTLGTAQLGQVYGIANITGKPSERIAHSILSTALDQGIKCIDTAPIYGNSEEIIGNYLYYHPKNCEVVTKLPHCNFENGHSFKEVYPVVKSWLNTSLYNLKATYIPMYLVRDVSQLDIIYDSLCKLKKERLIGKIGVSVYEPKELLDALKYPEIEVFQVPINLFDHRFIPYLPKLEGKLVFARSIFLQGLFFTDKTDKYVSKLEEICVEYHVSVKEAAVNFVSDLRYVTSLIIGMETTEQVRDNIHLIKSMPMTIELRDVIHKEFADMPLDVIDPRRWK